MIPQQTTLYLYRGATSTIEFDFTEFDFERNSKCVFTMTTLCGEVVKEIEFNQSKKYIVVFKDDETCNYVNNKYLYTIMYHINDERYPQCSDSTIIVEGIKGGYEGTN